MDRRNFLRLAVAAAVAPALPDVDLFSVRAQSLAAQAQVVAVDQALVFPADTSAVVAVHKYGRSLEVTYSCLRRLSRDRIDEDIAKIVKQMRLDKERTIVEHVG
jgi:hypothetical protein